MERAATLKTVIEDAKREMQEADDALRQTDRAERRRIAEVGVERRLLTGASPDAGDDDA
jgi:hypothetical protein